MAPNEHRLTILNAEFPLNKTQEVSSYDTVNILRLHLHKKTKVYETDEYKYNVWVEKTNKNWTLE
jgi:hypothetical protein